MDTNNVIEKAKNGFNKNLLLDNYHAIHSDNNQLKKLIDLIDIKDQGNYLDLATGNGYITFKLQSLYPQLNIFGLDIAEKAIERNNKVILEKQIGNLKFHTYDGMNIPYKSNFFNSIICRYAFHHFPDINWSISEISRILRMNGSFILSDPIPNEIDVERFIDKYMQLKDDGHVKFYSEKELTETFSKQGLKLEDKFYSKIRFPRPKDNRYLELISATDKKILDSYNVEIHQNEIFITLNVLNMKFKNTGLRVKL